MERVALLYGGRSSEHEISVITALQAVQALDSELYSIFPVYLALNGKWYTGAKLFERSFYKKLPAAYAELEEITLLPDPGIGGFTRLYDNKVLAADLCLLAFHGPYGEDGCVQGLLELADLPYTGSGVFSSAASMSKYHTKALLKAHDFNVLPSMMVRKKDAIHSLAKVRDNIINSLTYPLFVKPNNLGSSIGISKAVDASSLDAALAKVFLYDETALVEPLMTKFIELNVAVLDDDPPLVSKIEWPIASREALSYEDKYLRKGNKSSGTSEGMASLTRVIDPADIDDAVKIKLQQEAVRAFKILECSGVCRFDFMLDLKKGELIFNEVNSIPGSFSFYLWDKGEQPMLYTELLNRLLERCKKLKAVKRSLKREFGFYAL